MTINYKKLYSNNLTDEDFLVLQKVFQKEAALLEGFEDRFDYFEELGLVAFVKGKNRPQTIRLSKKGLSFFQDLLTPNMSEDVSKLLKSLMDLYETNKKDTGNKLEVKDRLLWFISVTGLSDKVIYDMTEQHVSNSGEYTMNLSNFIWRPASKAFSIHKNLKNSKLYDMCSQRYGLDDDIFINPAKSVEMDWMSDLTKIKPSKVFDKELFFTGSFKGDSAHINKVKKIYLSKLKK